VNSAESDNLNKFIHELEKPYADKGGVGCADLIDPAILSPDPLIAELVFSMLVWESSIEHGLRAVSRIQDDLIDLNELRVCTPEELSGILPSRYPRSLERCQRLISILNTIFITENRLSLVHLREMHKQDVIRYFKAIDGMTPFASSRVILFGLGWHAFPIDDWLTKQLSKRGITDTSLDIHQQTQRLERMVRASDSLRYYTLIEHWAQSKRAGKSTAHTNPSPSKSISKSPVSKSASKGSA